MKRFLMMAAALATTLVLSQSAQAQPAQKSGLQKVPSQSVLPETFDVEVNGAKGGSVRLLRDGASPLLTLKTGMRVSLLMKGGQPVGAQATDGQGATQPTEFAHNAVRRTIIIIIRGGDGTVIVIVIRQRAA
jgi:hypothetical protein